MKASRLTNKAVPFPSFSLNAVQASGADALELNLSCPHGMGERGMGLACGQVRASPVPCPPSAWGPCPVTDCTAGASDRLATPRCVSFARSGLATWKRKGLESQQQQIIRNYSSGQFHGGNITLRA